VFEVQPASGELQQFAHCVGVCWCVGKAVLDGKGVGMRAPGMGNNSALCFMYGTCATVRQWRWTPQAAFEPDTLCVSVWDSMQKFAHGSINTQFAPSAVCPCAGESGGQALLSHIACPCTFRHAFTTGTGTATFKVLLHLRCTPRGTLCLCLKGLGVCCQFDHLVFQCPAWCTCRVLLAANCSQHGRSCPSSSHAVTDTCSLQRCCSLLLLLLLSCAASMHRPDIGPPQVPAAHAGRVLQRRGRAAHPALFHQPRRP
jgi:hypothetical protein